MIFFYCRLVLSDKNEENSSVISRVQFDESLNAVNNIGTKLKNHIRVIITESSLKGTENKKVSLDNATSVVENCFLNNSKRFFSKFNGYRRVKGMEDQGNRQFLKAHKSQFFIMKKL